MSDLNTPTNADAATPDPTHPQAPATVTQADREREEIAAGFEAADDHHAARFVREQPQRDAARAAYNAECRQKAASLEALLTAGEAMLIAFAEGVSWTDDQRAAYTAFASALAMETTNG